MNLTRSLIVTVLDLILMCGCEEAGEAARFGVDSANAKERALKMGLERPNHEPSPHTYEVE